MSNGSLAFQVNFVPMILDPSDSQMKAILLLHHASLFHVASKEGPTNFVVILRLSSE